MDELEDRAFTEAMLDLYARAEALRLLFPAQRHQTALEALGRALALLAAGATARPRERQ